MVLKPYLAGYGFLFFLEGKKMAHKTKPFAVTFLASAISALAMAPVTSAQADDAFYKALTGGKVGFSARLRYEDVSQDNGREDAEALTLRSTLSYKTGAFHGFSGFAEIEDVSDLGVDDYDSLTNGQSQYAVIADPEGTEVNQAYLQYNGFDTEFRFGRQELTYRDAPFHRFIGTVLWRQNHQSFDAFTVKNNSFENLTLSYAYISEQHTIFGDDRNFGLIQDGDIAMDSHLFNAQYTGFSAGKVEAYAYLLDYEDAPDDNPNSRATYGVRFNGAQPLNEDVKVIYTAEYATQDDYADGDIDSQDYMLGEIGFKYKGWLAKLSYELQEGDGTSSFRTPLGTNHAFQGWADQYLNTPLAGLEDIYLTVVGKVLGAKVIVSYHDFETDEGSVDAGDELDILVAKKFAKHYTLGVKYADFDAGDNGSVDTEKFWVWGQVSY
jgi:hypothetical protein